MVFFYILIYGVVVPYHRCRIQVSIKSNFRLEWHYFFRSQLWYYIFQYHFNTVSRSAFDCSYLVCVFVHRLVLPHCGRVTQICVFNTVKLGTSASSP